MKHISPSSYELGFQVWTITERTLVTEKVYTLPIIDKTTGLYTDWGSYHDKTVWKETVSEPFIF